MSTVCCPRLVQLKLTARLNDALGAVRVALPGQFDNDLIVSLAVCPGHQRLGQTKGINAAPNGFFSLIHRLLLDI